MAAIRKSRIHSLGSQTKIAVTNEFFVSPKEKKRHIVFQRIVVLLRTGHANYCNVEILDPDPTFHPSEQVISPTEDSYPL